MSLSRPSVGLALAASLVASAHASDLVPFPLRAAAPGGSDVALLAPIPEFVADLAHRDAVTFADVALPGSEPVTLDLERVPLTLAPDALHVDGELVGGDLSHLRLSLWTGSVRGHGESDVFLSFSDVGSRGWITVDHETFHLSTNPGADRDWTRATNAFVRQSMLSSLGVEPQLSCSADRVHHATEPTLPMPHDTTPDVGGYLGGLPLYGTSIALETDWQFYEIFGDLGAAQAYAASLFGAVANRYRDQVGVILTLPYIAFYTSNNDGWDSQDFGGNSIDVLYEFQDAWDFGAAPVAADLYTMWSGAGLGGGVAYLDVLCNQDFGFSVSGNLAGVTPIPIIPNNPLNWDFVVTAHELGHNVATPHTHDYCPPIDQCAPDGYFGVCQTAEVCTSSGTIMSYCHLCDGGFDNVTTFFHPEVVDTLRDGVVSSCASPFEGVFAEDLGAALAGAGGVPALDASLALGVLQLDMSNLSNGAAGVLYLGFGQVNAPFKGGTLVPSPDVSISFVVTGSSETLAGPVSGFPTGIDLVAQAWFKEAPGPSGFSATNALALEVIAP